MASAIVGGLCSQDTSANTTSTSEPPLRLSGRVPDAETEDGRIRNTEAESKIRDAWIYKQIRNRQDEFVRYIEAKVFCGTWNVNAKKGEMDGALRMENWLGQGKQADIVCIGLQEIVDLNAVNVAVENKNDSIVDCILQQP